MQRRNLSRADIERFRPFCLTFHLQTPIVLGSPWLMFDGIISHLLNREMRGQDYYTLPSKEPVPQRFLYRGRVMPLANLRDVFRASVAWFDVPNEKAGIATIYKRFHEADCHQIDTSVKKIQVGRGHFRAYMMRLPYLPATSATFYVNGDIQEVLRLVQYLPGLGKKVAYGYGMIRSVSVEETAEDWSLVKDGVAMRPLPCSLGYDSDERMMLAFKPPYWDKRNVEPCVPPGARLKVYG